MTPDEIPKLQNRCGGAPMRSQVGSTAMHSRQFFRGCRSVVVATLKEIDSVVTDQVDEAMFLGDTTRPYVGAEIA